LKRYPPQGDAATRFQAVGTIMRLSALVRTPASRFSQPRSECGLIETGVGMIPAHKQGIAMTKLNDEICELANDELEGVSGGDVKKPPVKLGLAGSSFGGGSITKGGLNCNVAAGAFSSAD
jgi:hypothetical protein